MASLDLWTTLPVWIYQFQQLDAHIATAVSMLSLLGTWLLLTLIVLLDRSQSRRSASGGLGHDDDDAGGLFDVRRERRTLQWPPAPGSSSTG